MTYAFDCYLHIHASVLDWLVDSGRGIVVLRWDLAFDLLRDAPRIAIVEALLPTFQRAMRPGRLPELAVLASKWRAAA